MHLVISGGSNSDLKSEDIAVTTSVKVLLGIDGEHLSIHCFGHFAYWALGDSSELWNFSLSFIPSLLLPSLWTSTSWSISWNWLWSFCSDIWSVSFLYILTHTVPHTYLFPDILFPSVKIVHTSTFYCLLDSNQLHFKGAGTPRSGRWSLISPAGCGCASGASRNGSWWVIFFYFLICTRSISFVLICAWMKPKWLSTCGCWHGVEIRVWE